MFLSHWEPGWKNCSECACHSGHCEPVQSDWQRSSGTRPCSFASKQAQQPRCHSVWQRHLSKLQEIFPELPRVPRTHVLQKTFQVSIQLFVPLVPGAGFLFCSLNKACLGAEVQPSPTLLLVVFLSPKCLCDKALLQCQLRWHSPKVGINFLLLKRPQVKRHVDSFIVLFFTPSRSPPEPPQWT